ncbi:NlpC/P60 family protein [Microbulbifer sp. TYP-18]|uniref:SH3 domain-containing protein n=1 Tax=Microbulbifer sp. TYP-18 TaxID=3230024 RepID=UPI0034C6B4F4
MTTTAAIVAPILFGLALGAWASRAEVSPPASVAPAFVTDVPGIREEMLDPEYWIGRLRDDEIRMTAAEIGTFNAKNFARGEYLHDLDQFPQRLKRTRVLALLDTVSRPASTPRFHTDDSPLTPRDYAALEASTQRARIPAEVRVRWGMVVRRANMRSFPTQMRIYKNPQDTDLDRLQETGVFPGQRLALLHESADGNWWFAVNYHYAAWLPKSAVAVGDRDVIDRWSQREPRLLVTGAQVQTNFNPDDPRTSQVALDMGVSLPLLSAADVGYQVNGQNPYASYIVSLPARAADGSLEFVPTLIARSRDVHRGALAYRDSALLRQAFKFLGERYGWGHDYNGRDCTGFIGEVYKSFGILMPRNSGQQGRGGFAPTRFFGEGDEKRRRDALGSLQVGDLIYIPGHVMMYIGDVSGEPYVIHDVTGLRYYDSEKNFYSGTLSGVSVTPLKPLWLSRDKSFVDSIYAIKTIL